MNPSVGLLGGTFDPVHNGHVSIARSMLASSHIDELWIIPSYHPAHKNHQNITAFDDRVDLLECAFRPFPAVKICRIEQGLPSPGYTIRTLQHVQQLHPQTTFYWCIGSDSLMTFHTWYQYRDILQRCQLLVAMRPDFDATGVSFEILNRSLFVEHNPIAVSSSAIRSVLSTGAPCPDIHGDVRTMIEQKGLYR